VHFYSVANHGEGTPSTYARCDWYRGKCTGDRTGCGANGEPDAESNSFAISEPKSDAGANAEWKSDANAEPIANADAVTWRANADADARRTDAEPEPGCESDSNSNADPESAPAWLRLGHKEALAPKGT
jgi:hypothetical protein